MEPRAHSPGAGGWRRRLVLCVVLGGCAGDPAPEEAGFEAPSPDTTVTAPAAFDFAALTDFRGTPRGSAPAAFAHDAHATVTCATCHGDPPAHGRHGEMACDECHATPAGARATAPTECDACHHGPDQAAPCQGCHGTPSPAVHPLPRSLRLAGSTVRRTLAFSHRPHELLECTACHADGGRAAVTGDCLGCHDDHHAASSSCLACHEAPAAGVHGVDAHLGCGGAGCHTEARVLSLPRSRPVCLSCHPAQADHEIGADCAGCHLTDPRVGGLDA